MKTIIRPVILSGGAGTRLWPLSRRASPKQFHDLKGNGTLIQETAARVKGVGFAAPYVLANAALAGMIENQLATSAKPPALVILEPEPRNTAPAIAAAALAAEPDEILVVLPADHVIADADRFAAALTAGADTAASGFIVTFGVAPSSPETGFGYIKAGDVLDSGARAVAAFVEEPDIETARRYVTSGDYFWNAGIFMFRARTMIEELRRFCPRTLDAASRAIDRGVREGAALHLDPAAFADTIAQSIDYEVMEKTRRAAIAPISVGWSDIGSWAALWEIADKDAAGNTDVGREIVRIDCKDSLCVSTGPAVAMIGVQNLVVVATPDNVLVIPKECAQDVKKIVDALKDRGRTDLL